MPVAPRGFAHQFRVVQSELRLALSYATGFVYLTDELIAAIEDEAELAFVLAHEIVHIELYLPPNVDRNLVTSRTASELSERLHYHESVVDIMGLLALSRSDFAKDAERCARSILAKLQFASEIHPDRRTGRHDIHPSFADRLAQLDRNGYRILGLRIAFEGINDRGDVLYVAKILGVGRNAGDYQELYVVPSGTDLAKESPVVDRTFEGGFSTADGENYDIGIGELGFVVGGEDVAVVALEVYRGIRRERTFAARQRRQTIV